MPIRGWLRHKLSENRQGKIAYNISKELDSFRLGSNLGAAVMPISRKLEDINVKYPLIDPFAYAHISYSQQKDSILYTVVEPKLSEEERKTYKKISFSLIRTLELNLDKFFKEAESSSSAEGENAMDIDALKKNQILMYLKEKVKEVIFSEGLRLKPGELTRIMYYIYRDFVGLNQLEPLLADPYIEDIGCDGVGVPLYIQHKKYGSMKTNVVFYGFDATADFIIKLAERCGSYVTYAEPLLDSSLPDGSRVNATFTKDITTKGPTFSIRRFAKTPYSCIDLIKFGTGNSDIFAYLWYVVEHQKNFLVVGTTSSGKTSFLNALVSFIPPTNKIVSIEDTRELHLMHENWIPAVSRESFGSSSSGKDNYGEVSMFDLLKESFRQNPDYVIVGEVRGVEASVLFQGMASGHASFSTMHAGSVKDILERLTTPPISLSGSLVEALDVVIILQHAVQIGLNTRRIKEISEVVSVDVKNMKIDASSPFKWQPSSDKFTKRNSLVLERLSVEYGIDSKSIELEVKSRKLILDWLIKNNISKFDEVSEYITMYYNNKDKLFNLLNSKVRFTKTGMVANHWQVDINKELKKKVIAAQKSEDDAKYEKESLAIDPDELRSKISYPADELHQTSNKEKKQKDQTTGKDKPKDKEDDVDELMDKASFTNV